MHIDALQPGYRYPNDRRHAEITLIGLGFMAIISVFLIVAAVMRM